jgi:hypothetical protein
MSFAPARRRRNFRPRQSIPTRKCSPVSITNPSNRVADTSGSWTLPSLHRAPKCCLCAHHFSKNYHQAKSLPFGAAKPFASSIAISAEVGACDSAENGSYYPAPNNLSRGQSHGRQSAPPLKWKDRLPAKFPASNTLISFRYDGERHSEVAESIRRHPGIVFTLVPGLRSPSQGIRTHFGYTQKSPSSGFRWGGN